MTTELDPVTEMAQPSPNNDSGFVLISVIWIAGLLAVVTMTFAISVRSHILAGANVISGERAQYIADGMATLTAYRLATAPGGRQTVAINGEAAVCRWSEEAKVSVAVQDQGGLVDLNTASPQLLSGLLTGIGVLQDQATSIFLALRDYRDPDSQRADGGVEPVIYDRKPFGPKNAPFAVIEELDQIPGLDDDPFHRLLGLVTVHSQQPGIDPATAPDQLLRTLGIGRSFEDGLQFASPSPRRVFAIDVAVEMKDRSRYVRHAIVSLLRQPERPFAILAWQQGSWNERAIAMNAALPLCLN